MAVPYRQTFVRLLAFLRPYKWSLWVSVVLAVGSQACAVLMAWLTGTTLESVLTSKSTHDLWVLIGLVFVVGLMRAVLMLGRRLISGKQALGVEFDMRNALYAKLVRLSFGFYDRHQTGQLMSRATVDLQTVRFFLGYGLIFFFQHVLTVVGVTVVMFFVNWKLALVALAITPFLIVLAYRYSHVSHPVLRDVQQQLGDVATVAEENIVGVHVVKSFAQERAESEKFESRSEAVFDQSVRANRQRALYVPLLSFLPLLAQAAVLLVGGHMVVERRAHARRLLLLQPPDADARHAAADARHVDRPGPARDRLRRADLRDDRRARGDRATRPTPASSRRARAASASRTSRSATPATGRCCTTSTSRSSPATRSR